MSTACRARLVVGLAERAEAEEGAAREVHALALALERQSEAGLPPHIAAVPDHI